MVFDAIVAYGKKGSSSYFVMMTARPQTVGYGVTDSPAGLAAWVLVHPGFACWTHGSDPEQSPTKDDVLDRDPAAGGNHGISGGCVPPPETWARCAYRDLIYFHKVNKGGHFAAWEQPRLFSEELQVAFRSLRAGSARASPSQQ